jgi:signal transduction histidine kinase
MLLTSRYPMVLTWGPEFVQFYNDAYAKLIGAKHPDALGIDIRITLAEAWTTLGPMIAEVMRSGVANWTPALPLLLLRHGYREESYFSVSHAPAENDQGEIVGMLAVCSEVTQQVISERRLRLLRDLASQPADTRTLRQSCDTMAQVLAGNPLDVPFSVFYLREEDGVFRLVATSGVDAAEVAVPQAFRAGDGEDGETWGLARAATHAGSVEVNLAGRLALRGGFFSDPVTTALACALDSGTPGEPLGLLVSGVSPNRALDDDYRGFFDLLAREVNTALRTLMAVEEERKRADLLAELDRSKTIFFNNVSHEFRTPLTLMLGPVEELLAQAQQRGDRTQHQVLDTILRNALRLLKLVNTLLDFARLEGGKLEAKVEPVDLAAVTAEIAETFRGAMTKAGLRFVVQCDETGTVEIDRDMWEKIVLNLLSNALKFTSCGSVEVRLWGRDSTLELAVTDTGPGIPAQALPRLFDRFYRVEGMHGRSHEGSGIGLSLVRDLARLQGGTATVESEVGCGSTFRVALPMRRAEARAPARSSGSSVTRGYHAESESWLKASAVTRADDPDHAKPLVLVVDDNADMRDYIARLLSPSCEVVTAEDGAVGLKRAAQLRPELIVSDIMMPVLDGFALLQQLRADPALATTPVIFLSARAGEEAKVEGIRAKADDYLTKPFSASELVARVTTMIELSRLRSETVRQRATAEEQERLRARLEETVAERTAELNRVVARLEAFSYSLSHDLRAPLRTIEGFISILREERSTLSAEEVDEYLRRVNAAVKRMGRLFEDVLAATRASRAQLNLEAVRIEEIIADVIDDRPELQLPKAAVTVQAPLAPVWADRSGLLQCLANLLGNAVKFVPPGKTPKVRLWTEARDQRVRLWIEDNGIGIAPHDRPKLFQPFHRGSNAIRYEGTGLGLSIVSDAVARMGGAIGVESASGEGSRFWIELRPA